MKNFKRTLILLSLISFISCQNEENDTENDVLNEVVESNILDDKYVQDLEIYKETQIVFENAEYSIKEVLSDPVLFDYYTNASVHYFYESENDNMNVLYVTPHDAEKSATMIAKVESNIEAIAQENSRSAKTTANLGYNFITSLYKNTNYNGGVYKWNRSGNIGSNDNNKVRRNINLPGWISNEASSIRWSRTIESDVSSGNLKIYRNANLNGTNSTIVGARNIANLNFNAVGNDHIESMAFVVTLSLIHI